MGMAEPRGCLHVCMANVSPLAGVSGLGRCGVKGRGGLDDTHSSLPGLTKKDEHVFCPQLLLPSRAVSGTVAPSAHKELSSRVRPSP